MKNALHDSRGSWYESDAIVALMLQFAKVFTFKGCVSVTCTKFPKIFVIYIYLWIKKITSVCTKKWKHLWGVGSSSYYLLVIGRPNRKVFFDEALLWNVIKYGKIYIKIDKKTLFHLCLIHFSDWFRDSSLPESQVFRYQQTHH